MRHQKEVTKSLLSPFVKTAKIKQNQGGVCKLENLKPYIPDAREVIYCTCVQGGEPTSWSLMFQKKIISDQMIK